MSQVFLRLILIDACTNEFSIFFRFEFGWTLWVVNGFERSTDYKFHLHVVEEDTALSFGGRAYNVLEDFALGVNGCVVGGTIVVKMVWKGFEVELSGVSSLCAGDNEILRSRFIRKLHVVCKVP